MNELLARFGLTWGRGVVWDNYAGDHTIGGQDLNDVYHELAHFLVATPAARRRRNWGLGDPGDWPDSIYERRRRQKREEEASALGIHLLWLSGHTKLAKLDYVNHCWNARPYWGQKVYPGNATYRRALRAALKRAAQHPAFSPDLFVDLKTRKL